MCICHWSVTNPLEKAESHKRCIELSSDQVYINPLILTADPGLKMYSIRPNKKICLFPVTYLKIIGSVGRYFFFFFNYFFLRIVMHHNAAKSKNRHYTLNFHIFTLEDKLEMFWSCQFGLKLIHMNQKYVFLFSSLLEWIKSFGSGGFKQGRSGYRKQT